MLWNNFAKRDQISMVCCIDGWKDWYGRRTTCMVSTETVAPLQDNVPADHGFWIVEFLHEEHLALFHWNCGRLTVGTLTPSISLQDLGLCAAVRVQEAKHDFAQLKQLLVAVWAHFEQTIVEKAIAQYRSNSGPVSRLKDSMLMHAMTCDATHCLIQFWTDVSVNICC